MSGLETTGDVMRWRPMGEADVVCSTPDNGAAFGFFRSEPLPTERRMERKTDEKDARGVLLFESRRAPSAVKIWSLGRLEGVLLFDLGGAGEGGPCPARARPLREFLRELMGSSMWWTMGASSILEGREGTGGTSCGGSVTCE